MKILLICLLLILASCTAKPETFVCPPTEVNVQITPDINKYLQKEIDYYKYQVSMCAEAYKDMTLRCPEL